MDLLMTWASGTEFLQSPYFQIYLKSLSKIPCKKVIFTVDDISFDGIDVIKCNLKSHIYIERHFFFWEYLRQNKYRYVIHTDAKDVIFQKNFIPYLESNYGDKFVILSSEGMKYHQSHWNMVEQMRCQQSTPNHEVDFKDWDVLNGGVQIGTCEEMANLFFLLWTNSCRTRNCTDQAVLNYLYYYLKKDNIYRISCPHKNPLVLTGEGVKWGHVSVDFRNGRFCMKDGEEYYIVHQWDRTNFKEDILQNSN